MQPKPEPMDTIEMGKQNYLLNLISLKCPSEKYFTTSATYESIHTARPRLFWNLAFMQDPGFM